ncbi:helix-turn-helix domain-containing protein [Psychrobacter aquimaris]|uniref:helix-turn-helix domain-containing protein n=1 Tax=Psychrobacter aquimaris TaxID=292733 RepID=UPI003FD33FB1
MKISDISFSAFYTHFHLVTAMTPLQFQKNLRLNEARRLMLTEGLDATATAFKVGYESPSQFSREYRRLFGESPLKDIRVLRETEQYQEAKSSASIISS